MAFKDWVDTEHADPLILPINGTAYRIPELGHLDAIKLREERTRILAGEAPTIGNEEFVDMILGPVAEQMRADNVPQRAIIHAAAVAFSDSTEGREVAELLWEKGPNPQALMEAIRAASDSSTTSPNTPRPARTSSTNRRASTASTRSRKTKASPSTGKTSSRSRS